MMFFRNTLFDSARRMVLVFVGMIFCTIICTAHNRALDSITAVIASADAQGRRDSSVLNGLIDAAFEEHNNYPDHALQLIMKAEKLAVESKDSLKLATALNVTGLIYLNKGFYSIALDNVLRALAMRERIGDTVGIASSLNNLGLIYRNLGSYSQSLQCFQRAFILHTRLANKDGLAAIHTNLGVTYQAQQRFDSALAGHQQALAIYQQLGNTEGIGRAYTNIGEALRGLGRYEQSLASLFNALTIHRTLNNSRSIMIALLGIAKVYDAMHNTSDVVRYAHQALVLADSLKARDEQRDILLLLAEAYQTNGHLTNALEFRRRYDTIKDSLYDSQNNILMAEMQVRYEAEQKNKEISLLQRDSEIQRLELSRHVAVRNLLVASVVLLVTLLAVFVNRFRLKQRTARLLRGQNEELHRANAEILRQQRILEDQAAEIEVANTELHETNIRLHEIDQEKNEFLGIAAHDLKNPLSSIMMVVSMVQRYRTHLSEEEVAEQLSKVEMTARRMSEIITNLLDVNAIETGMLHLEWTSYAAAPVVEHIVDHHKLRAESKQITLICELDPETRIYGDCNRTIAVIDNLVSNAIKYSPPGKRVWIEVKGQAMSAKKHGSNLKPVPCCSILVKDEGPGLSAEDKEKLFGKFVRLTAQPTGGEHSTGLGLSIVKKLVEAMSGRVWCESELGKGATFIVELPSEELHLRE